MTIKISEPDFSSVSPEVRSISLNANKNNLLLGTYGSEIYEIQINFETKNVDKIIPLMKGHYSPRRKVVFLNNWVV